MTYTRQHVQDLVRAENIAKKQNKEWLLDALKSARLMEDKEEARILNLAVKVYDMVQIRCKLEQFGQ